MIIWLASLVVNGSNVLPFAFAGSLLPHQWHAHEMLFGYTLAVNAGFLLTAVPSWTKTRPIQGFVLGALAAVWVAGRAAVWGSAYLPGEIVAVIDLAFVPVVLLAIAPAVMANWTPRNIIFLPILGAMLAANLLVHLDLLGVTEGTVGAGHGLALNTAVVLIAILGGRMVPAFTTNALKKKGEADLPVSRKPVEVASILSIVVWGVMDVMPAAEVYAGFAAAIAAAVHAVRYAGWRGYRTLDEPIVWIMHFAYLWLVIGLGLKAVAGLSGAVDNVTAVHALSAGAIGCMTMAIMTRAALGHTGRVIKAAPGIVGAYFLLGGAVVIRVVVPIWLPALHHGALAVSGGLWAAAFTIMFWGYAPILLRRRLGEPAG